MKHTNVPTSTYILVITALAILGLLIYTIIDGNRERTFKVEACDASNECVEVTQIEAKAFTFKDDRLLFFSGGEITASLQISKDKKINVISIKNDKKN